MIIARTEEEIDRLMDFFIKSKNYEGPFVYKDGKRIPLDYWRENMKRRLKENGYLGFIIRPIWSNDSMINVVDWESVSTVDNYINMMIEDGKESKNI